MVRSCRCKDMSRTCATLLKDGLVFSFTGKPPLPWTRLCELREGPNSVVMVARCFLEPLKAHNEETTTRVGKALLRTSSLESHSDVHVHSS